MVGLFFFPVQFKAKRPMELDGVLFENQSPFDAMPVAESDERPQFFFQSIDDRNQPCGSNPWCPNNPVVEHLEFPMRQPNLTDAVEDPNWSAKTGDQQIRSGNEWPATDLRTKNHVPTAEPFDDPVLAGGGRFWLA